MNIVLRDLVTATWITIMVLAVPDKLHALDFGVYGGPGSGPTDGGGMLLETDFGRPFKYPIYFHLTHYALDNAGENTGIAATWRFTLLADRVRIQPGLAYLDRTENIVGHFNATLCGSFVFLRGEKARGAAGMCHYSRPSVKDPGDNVLFAGGEFAWKNRSGQP